jgi:hypothetical protein
MAGWLYAFWDLKWRVGICFTDNELYCLWLEIIALLELLCCYHLLVWIGWWWPDQSIRYRCAMHGDGRRRVDHVG